MKVEVNCYSGYKANERPESFVLGDEKLEVEEILDSWYGPDYVYFKLTAQNSNRYILKYSEKSDEWSIEFYDKNSTGWPK